MRGHFTTNEDSTIYKELLQITMENTENSVVHWAKDFKKQQKDICKWQIGT